MEDQQPYSPIEMAAEIVAAYVSNNSVPFAGLADLIASVHGALAGLGTPTDPAEPKVEKATAAKIRKSITDDALISFEDGKPYKTLKRHLMMRSLSPEAYRSKYGLPADYPMTSPAYSAQRSKLARSFGLGRKRWAAMSEGAETVSSDAPIAPRGHAKASANPQAVPEKAKGRARVRKVAEVSEAKQES